MAGLAQDVGSGLGQVGDGSRRDAGLPAGAVSVPAAIAHRTSRATNAARSDVSRRMVTGTRAALARASVAE
jgi:hypothetical protein